MPERLRPPAKITRPRIRGVFPRERLFRLLDEARTSPVIWISAPAGSGKTTLVAGYLEEKAIPSLWYQVDERDADLPTFFNYLRLAAKKAAPRKRNPLPFLTPEYLSSLSIFAKKYFEELFSRLRSGSVLVLDNYQTVPAASPFHDLISQGIGTVPDGIQVIVISRHDPPPVLSGLRANGLIKKLGWSDLRLTLEETTGIVTLKTGVILPRKVVKQLHQAADGWMAGLVLMLESVKRGWEPHLLGKMAPEEILDYFGNEFFNKAHPEVQEFLLRSAFLPKISVDTAERISGFPQAGKILSTLSRNNTFTEQHISTEPVYQYHPLFREFLLARARETFSRETLSVLRHQAAGLLEREGQIEAAAGLFQDLADWGALVRLIMKQAPAMLEQGRIGPLEAWLGSLPRPLLEEDPWLLYWMGVCRLQATPAQSQPWFEKSFEKFLPRGEMAGICLSLWGVVHAVIYAMADFNPLDRWIGVLEELALQSPSFPSEEIELRFVTALYSALVYRQPRHPGLETWEGKALGLAARSSNLQLKLQTFSTVALYRATKGDFTRALQAINTIKKWAPPKESAPLIQIRLKAVEAACYKYQGSPETCMKAVSDGLALSRASGITVFVPMLCYHGATSALGMNDYPAAQKFIDLMASSQKNFRPYDLIIYHSLKVQESLFLGDSAQALLHIEQATKMKNKAGFDLINGWCLIQNAYVRHVLGRPGEAEKFLNRAMEFARAIGGNNNIYAAHLAQAHFAFDQGREQEGLTAIGRAFALGRECGNYSTWGPPRPSEVARLCRKALESGIEVDYVREFIRRFRFLPDRTAVSLEKWPWPLKIYTLGRFELVKDDKPVQFTGKIQKKPLLLLKAVIALGGKDVAEEQLMDILWPEAEGDRAHSALNTNLSRLRRLIGENILEVQAGRVHLNPQTCWVDARAFEDLVEKVESSSRGLRPGDCPSAVMQWLGRAIDLYRGLFLAEEGFELYWALPLRERLSGKFLALTEKLGRSLEEKQQWDQAAACYQKGLEADSLAEELYRRLMVCYAGRGEKVKAVQVYRRLKSTLSSVLGVEPSPKTEALYRDLTASR